MRKQIYRRIILGYPVVAEVTILNEGVHILLSGGVRTHIGAVSICSENGMQTMEEQHHRESVISESWAETLYHAWNCPVTVACGIHYDQIKKESLCLLVEETEDMLEEVVRGNR